MKFSRVVFTFSLIAATVQLSFPPANWSQGHQTVDPDIPPYLSDNSASGMLTIAASEGMQLLVQTWINDLLLRHPDLKITVIPTNSKKSLATFIARKTELLATSRALTRTEISEFVLQYGYEPIAIPVAGNTLSILIRKITSFAARSHDLNTAAIPVLLTSVNAGGNIGPLHTVTSGSYLIKRRRYLYLTTPPNEFPSQAASELVRYALSKQGQQLAFDLGHVPLTSSEIAQARSRWPPCCSIP